MAACVLVLACDALTDSVPGLQDTGRFTISESRDAGGTVLHVSGSSCHSAKVVSRVTEATEGDTLVLAVHVVLAQDDGRSGDFVHEIHVPRGVVRVVYGDERREIWPARP